MDKPPAQDARIQSLFLDGPAGQLEALINTGAPDARYAALVCHPHPLYGGTMHNKVVYSAMKALNGLGFPVLRFNFRGVGLSPGAHDYGQGEQQDVRAALEWLRREYGLPIVFAGFSFGSIVGLPACFPEPDVKALIAVGLPLRDEGRTYDYDSLKRCSKPKLFVSSDHDQYAPADLLRQTIEAAADPKRLVLIEGGDHFFQGRLPVLREVVQAWIRETLD